MSGSHPARLRATTLTLTGSALGPASPLPAFEPLRALPPAEVGPDADAAMSTRVRAGRLTSPLPYPVLSDYSRRDEELALPALVLDNGVLEATVLPTLGGRVWSLRDRGRGRDLLFTPSALRFANVGLTDAWFAGGIEWNLGSTGHTALSNRGVHAARVATSDGDVLRLWEWERTRDLVLQVDLSLDGDRLLASTRVINPDPEPTPLYWWTNVAVPETAGTRVLVDARLAWRTDHRGRLSRVRVPHPDTPEVDVSRPRAAARAADYFFVSEPPGRVVAAVEPDGRGFAQTSTDELTGRKLFLWGDAPGGRRWQEWLGGPGSRYAEIQAGWCLTQMEHDTLPGHGEVSWTEAFGAVDLDPDDVAADFPTASLAARTAVHAVVPPAALAARHARWRAEVADAAPSGVLGTGSGWGHAELVLRARLGERSPVPTTALPFPPVDDDSATALALLQGDVDVVRATANRLPVPPVSPRWGLVMADRRWDDEPWVLHARGTAAHLRGDLEEAERCYSVAVERGGAPVGARRGLALLAAGRGEDERAAGLYAQASADAPDVRTLLTERVAHLLQAGWAADALAALDAAPPAAREHGRSLLLRAHALLATGDRDGAAALLQDLEVQDLAEGGLQLSRLWDEVHPGSPLPARLDFRMT